MSSEYNRIDLLAVIKKYNKTHEDKIKNVDKLKKEELLEICKKYSLLSAIPEYVQQIDLHTLNKRILLQDVEIHFMKQNKPIPQSIFQMRKENLVYFMEENGIPHYSQDLIEKEIANYNKRHYAKNVIVYNIIKYDNIDVSQIYDDDLESFITDKNLDTNVQNLQAYSKLLYELYAAYDSFCAAVKEFPKSEDKIKSFPKIMAHLNKIV